MLGVVAQHSARRGTLSVHALCLRRWPVIRASVLHCAGAKQLTLEGVYHSPLGAAAPAADGSNPGRPWYGSPGVIDRWADEIFRDPSELAGVRRHAQDRPMSCRRAAGCACSSWRRQGTRRAHCQAEPGLMRCCLQGIRSASRAQVMLSPSAVRAGFQKELGAVADDSMLPGAENVQQL